VTKALGPCGVVWLGLDGGAELRSSHAYGGPEPVTEVEILLSLMQPAKDGAASDVSALDLPTASAPKRASGIFARILAAPPITMMIGMPS
jgi:hypothetical protein